MPLILFNDGLRNPDLKLPRIHPWRAERPGDPFPPSRFILLSVQEGNILRVAMYYPEMDELERQIDYWNGSGIDVTGLPAAHLRGTRDSAIFGDSLFSSLMCGRTPFWAPRNGPTASGGSASTATITGLLYTETGLFAPNT